MIEILAENLENLFKNTILKGTCTYKHNPKEEYEVAYEIWEISEDDFEIICNMEDERFKEYCPNGWWIHSEGSIMGYPLDNYVINGQKILAWDGYSRKHWYKECATCSDYHNKLCKGEAIDWEDCFGNREYDNIFYYLCDELNVSNLTNTTALLVDLAKYNNMKISELLNKYY